LKNRSGVVFALPMLFLPVHIESVKILESGRFSSPCFLYVHCTPLQPQVLDKSSRQETSDVPLQCDRSPDSPANQHDSFTPNKAAPALLDVHNCTHAPELRCFRSSGVQSTETLQDDSSA